MQRMTAIGDGVVDDGRFTFVGEALPLDLVNTEQVVRGKPVDLLTAPAHGAEWWRAAAARYPSALDGEGPRLDDPEFFAALITMRSTFRRIFEAAADGRSPAVDDLDLLNAVLRSGYVSLEPDRGGVVRAVMRSDASGPAGTLLPLARTAVTLLTERDLSRLHRCGNERCVLLFYDTTKSGTRRWCSLGCMNRARSSRRYRERTHKPEA